MTEPLEFRSKLKAESESWERADATRALIETVAWDRWRVTLPDGDDVHECRLHRDHGAFIGECDCEGFQYHDGPCAHLCAVRKAAFGRVVDTRGRPVTIHDIEDVETERYDAKIEQALADGGRVDLDGGVR